MSAKKVMTSQEKVLHLVKILHDYIVMASQQKVWLILTDDNDEREKSDGQSGEGLSSHQSFIWSYSEGYIMMASQEKVFHLPKIYMII